MEWIKIFPAETIKKIDRITIEKQNITSEQLMERAITRLMPYVENKIGKESKIVIFSGVGNNGGDGLVLARKLWQKGYDTEVCIVRFSDKESVDFQVNYNRLLEAKVPVYDFVGQKPGRADIVIDAVLGVGLNRPAEGVAAEAIDFMNRNGGNIFSVDMPSGLFADRPNGNSDAVVKASHVYTFQFPKLSFFFAENEAFVPDFSIVDIGLDAEAIEQIPAGTYYLLAPWKIPPRGKFASKNRFGHVLIIGGSEGKSGAAGFSAMGAFRSGAGWVSAFVPKKSVAVLQTRFPEIMTLTGKGKRFHKDFSSLKGRYTLAVGPGLGRHRKTVSAFGALLETLDEPAVFDADALNILARKKSLLHLLPPRSVLTPHLKEFARLTGRSPENSLEKISMAKDFARTHKIILVLKGAYTLITDGEKLVFNSTGNPSLAKAGSGDVLTGIIAGLLARGLSPWQSAVTGVYLHGKAADLWIKRYDENALTPSGLINLLKEKEVWTW